MRGRLIALEGIDGSGKTTQARLLREHLGADSTVLTAEPGGTDLGRRLRRLLLDPGLPPVAERTEALLLAADRAEHVLEVVGPALEAGRWVVSDRYSASTLAYQGYGRGGDLKQLRALVEWATEGLVADLYVLVDVPVEVARSRIDAGDADRLESLDAGFHRRVAQGYRELAGGEPERWAVVDGTKQVDEVAQAVRREVQARLGTPSARVR